MFIKELTPGDTMIIPEAAEWIFAVETGTVVLICQGAEVPLTMRRGEMQFACFREIRSCAMRIRVGNTAPPVHGAPESAGSGSSPCALNKAMVALVTSGDGAKACATPVAAAPVGFVAVSVNGVLYAPGPSSSAPCYFAAPAVPGIPRAAGSVLAGDLLYWRGSVAGFELAPSDVIDLYYNI